MRTKLVVEIDQLLSEHIDSHQRLGEPLECRPSKEFPNIFLLLQALREREGEE